MQITNQNSGINFRGIPLGVAKVVGRDGKKAKLSLYKLTKEDDTFLGKLERSIDTRKLQDGFTDEQYSLWNDIIITGISDCRWQGRGLLVAKDNVPCGILSYKPENTTLTVPHVATWPVEKNKKIPLAGKTLFMQFFKSVIDSDMPQVSLKALKDSVYTPAEHFKSIGFRKTSEGNWYVNMKIDKKHVEKNLKKLEELINFTPAKNQKEVNLSKELELTKRKRKWFIF